MFTAYPAEEHRLSLEMEFLFPEERLTPLRTFYETRIEGSYYIDTFAVLEAFRRTGIGTSLLNGARRRALQNGHESLSLRKSKTPRAEDEVEDDDEESDDADDDSKSSSKHRKIPSWAEAIDMIVRGK